MHADVRRLLRHLDDPRELRRSALVGHFFQASDERTPRAAANAAAMARVRALLGRALERIEPAPGNAAPRATRERRLHAIIAQCDVAGEKHETVARDLGLSLRQFYRERHHAFERLADALEAELAAGDGAANGTAAAHRSAHNLPWQPTSFVGRARELEELAALLAPRRLVTITGSGGTGKTRLALEISARFAPPRDGIWFVDLSTVGEPDFVADKIASVLELRPADSGDRGPALVAALAGRELLLLLDNCEHVIDAVRPIATAIVRGCSGISLMATSRERLAIGGETAYQLSPLPVPAAIELFAERAAAARSDAALEDGELEAVADICRRVDGIPLAIELAAARLPVLGLAALRAQLSQHFGVISGGYRDAPARQRTLDATIAWSYDLLDERDRTLFRRLAIFAGGWTLEAAAAVCADAALDETSAIEALCSLVERSLVQVDLDAPIPRYAFFESTRAYALARLAGAGERRELARRHAQWMAAFADAAFDDFLSTTRSRWGSTVIPETENVRAALDWSLGADGDAALGARIASGLVGLWLIAGNSAHGRRYLEAAWAQLGEREQPALLARVLLGRSQFLHGTPNEEALRRATALVETAAEPRLLVRCHTFLAYTLLRKGDLEEALETSQRASEIFAREGLLRSPLYARLLGDRSAILRAQGTPEAARAPREEALALADELDDEWSRALFRSQLAEIEFLDGNRELAIELTEAALENARRVRQEPFVLCNLAGYRLALGRIDEAIPCLREALALSPSNPYDVQAAVGHCATIAALRGQYARAAVLIGYVDAWFERSGAQRDASDRMYYDTLMSLLRPELGDAQIAALRAQGAARSDEAIVPEALAL